MSFTRKYDLILILLTQRRRSFTWRRRFLIPEDFSDSPSPKNFGFDSVGTYDLDWDLQFGLGLVNNNDNT